MKFTIAHSGFTVRISRDEILKDQNGQEAAGLRDWPHQCVWLAGAHQMPVQRREETLAHELWHLWKLKFGATADEESEANQVASFTVWFLHEFERQGGNGALMRLQPDGVVNQGAAVDLSAEIRQPQCPQCGGYLDMPIQTGPAHFDFPHTRLVVDRSGDCSFCSHTVAWKEVSTTKGVPTGNVIGDPAVRALAHAGP